MRPLLSVHSGDFAELNEMIAQNDGKFLQPVPEQWDLEFDDFLSSVKTAALFESWIDEKTEDQILAAPGVAPGELRSKLQIADWLIYSLQEIALLLGHKDSLKPVRKLRVRMKYGIREELLPLVRLRGIGRARSRKLFNAGLKSLSELRKVPLESLSRIVGPNVAPMIKEQLGEKIKQPKKARQVTLDINKMMR
jgi:helicase